MSRELALSLPDQLYEAVKKSAEAAGSTPEQWIAMKLADMLSPIDANNGSAQTHQAVREVLEQLAVEMSVTYEQLESDWHAKYGAKPQRAASTSDWHVTDENLLKYVGALSLGHPLGTDNEDIDADLAREYSGSEKHAE